MLRIKALTSAAILSLWATSASAQNDNVFLASDSRLSRKPERRSCAEDHAPIGRIRGQVEFQFQVAGDGKADPATVVVLQASRVSPETGGSAARRMLPHCEFRAGEMNRAPVRTVLVQRIDFDDLKIRVRDTRIPPSFQPVPTATGGAATIDLDSVYLDTDPLVDEKILVFDCAKRLGPQHTGGLAGLASLTSRASAAILSFVVLPDGRPDASSIRHEQGTNMEWVEVDRSSILSCTYLPGRIRGRAVKVRVDYNHWPLRG